jgi:acyl-CoA synthetase (AMP-forming)/AMP-acid ligase II/acyl carrier protein
MLAVTTLSFDIAVLELLLPLTVGARVVIAPGAIVADGAALAAELRRTGVTVLQGTPATWQLLVRSGWRDDGVRMLCGGEELPRSLANELLGRGAELWNLYGPTETTVWSALHRVDGGAAGVPLGRPIANTQIHLVDDRGRPVPPGAVGEAWIGGAGVARGYHDRPALTGERFVPDVFGGAAGARLYRTGDLARFDGAGSLQFLGRRDHQVKLRGFRIELGEIQAALAAAPGVDQAVVTLGDGSGAAARLVAYVVPADTASAPPVAVLRSALAHRLPAYMVPSVFMMLEALPLTPNGKLDRRALPRPELLGSAATAPPETPTQLLVAEIWSELLGVKEVGLEDDFFALGGHSLLATQLVSRIRGAFDLELPLRTIFEAPALRSLADEIDGGALGDVDAEELEREIEAIKSLSDEELQAVIENRKAGE